MLVERCSTWSYQAGGQRERPKRRFVDVVREDKAIANVRE